MQRRSSYTEKRSLCLGAYVYLGRQGCANVSLWWVGQQSIATASLRIYGVITELELYADIARSDDGTFWCLESELEYDDLVVSAA